MQTFDNSGSNLELLPNEILTKHDVNFKIIGFTAGLLYYTAFIVFLGVPNKLLSYV